MKVKTILFYSLAALATALGGAVQEADAQFTMNSIARGGDHVPVEIPVEPGDIDASIINRAREKVIRREIWNGRNNVDFRASLTGMVTQHNKSWTTNNQNSVSSELSVYYYHIFTRDKYSSTFKFDGRYGMNYIDDVWFKHQDYLSLYHLSSWKMRDRGVLRNWAYSFSANFTSQFAEGYESRAKQEQVWSNFMAPGAFNVGVGFTYNSPKPRLPFVVTVNPLSGDALFVLDDRITDERRLKLGIPNVRDADGLLPNYKIEGGSSLNVNFNRTWNLGGGERTVQYVSTLTSFYGWMTQIARHTPTGEDVVLPVAIRPTGRWENTVRFTPLKFLTMEFRTTSLYDRSQVNKVQMQYYLRVGLTYGYKNR
jgi:hypothetical protein